MCYGYITGQAVGQPCVRVRVDSARAGAEPDHGRERCHVAPETWPDWLLRTSVVFFAAPSLARMWSRRRAGESICCSNATYSGLVYPGTAKMGLPIYDTRWGVRVAKCARWQRLRMLFVVCVSLFFFRGKAMATGREKPMIKSYVPEASPFPEAMAFCVVQDPTTFSDPTVKPTNPKPSTAVTNSGLSVECIRFLAGVV